MSLNIVNPEDLTLSDGGGAMNENNITTERNESPGNRPVAHIITEHIPQRSTTYHHNDDHGYQLSDQGVYNDDSEADMEDVRLDEGSSVQNLEGEEEGLRETEEESKERKLESETTPVKEMESSAKDIAANATMNLTETNGTSDAQISSPSLEKCDVTNSEKEIKTTEVKNGKEHRDLISGPLPNTKVIHSTKETPEETFCRLNDGIQSGRMSHKDILDSVFNVLVGGAFDLESNFIIEDAENIIRLVDLLDGASTRLQAEVWSVFVGVVRKSNRNLEACSRVGLITRLLDRLSSSDSVVSDLFIQLLSVLTSYSITVKETKRFLKELKAEDGHWKRNASKLLYVLQEMPRRDGADVFFSFPGLPNAGIALPPLTKWPYQNGWTFSTWLRMDPLNSVNFEKERPYLYCFRTSKGVGYECYFMGNCLVISSVRYPGKETARCIRHELSPRKWHHVAISYIYSRWSKSEVQCFIDGRLIETIDMTWLVSTTDQWDRCFIGCGPEGEEPFCGQLAALYIFAEQISIQQANSLYCLGAAYQSSFRHEAECSLPEGYRKVR
ncbi:hypothetical protein AB6A40_005130 [Gnathostoma spinigerum]|uniref:Neurobeachin alpha-solenoid region domain-containing protein n=1 Tax=Gnathostoma spinigerum TaxID=75299 RepID=A0ABD6EGT9_9BILA